MAHAPLYLPALRCFVGDRWFYCSAMTFAQVAGRVVRSDELVTSKALNDLIQRTLTDRSKEIVRYIETQTQRFFNSLVLAVFEGDPEWLDIRLLDSDFLPSDLPDNEIEQFNSRIGLLRLSGAEKLFALDGQHRVEGIKQALEGNVEFASEEISVLFVSHKAGPEGRERTRRLFTTLNRYAKAVSAYEKIALDEDDALAIVTRRLLNEHPFLSERRTAYSKTANISSTDRVSLTTLPVVYEIATALIKGRSIGGEKWTKDRIAYPRPKDETLNKIFELASSFWNEFGRWAPEFVVAAHTDDDSRAALNIRSKEGGPIAFRPIIQLALGRVVQRWLDSGQTVPSVFVNLRNVPRHLTDDPWQQVIWDPVGKKMIASPEAKEVATGLLLLWSGYPVDVDMVRRGYRSLVGRADANLPEV